MSGTDSLLLVCFDIVDDRVRYRVVKALKGYGVRVQKSVFECPRMTEHQYLSLRSRLSDLIDHGEDSVRYYHLCRGCIPRVQWDGLGDPPLSSGFKVV